MAHQSEIIRSELEALAKRTGRDRLDVLETGSIRHEGAQYHSNDGWSTLTFAEYVDAHGGTACSIDLDVRAADAVLRSRGLRDHVELVEGYSVDVLALMLATVDDGFDAILLDSDNDADLILHEFLIAQHLVRRPGVILVDDVEPGSTDVVKGAKLVPWLEARGVVFRLTRRTGDDGFSSGMMVIEYA